MCSILTPTGKTFMGTFARNYHQICRKQKKKLWIYHVSLTRITQETSSLGDRTTLGSIFTSRTRRLYGFWNNRILLSPPVLEVNLLRSVPQKISLSRCDTSFECLACQLMVRPKYSVITAELWRIQRDLNLNLQRSIMLSVIMRYVRRLPRKSYAWVKRTTRLIWQTCSRRCSLPINVEPSVATSCINSVDMPWVIGRHVGEVFYPLERTRSAGSNTRLWRTNRWLGLNHSITRTHDLRGPFKYGQYGTETASTIVIGDAESVGIHFYHLLLSYTPFCYYFIVYLVPTR